MAGGKGLMALWEITEAVVTVVTGKSKDKITDFSKAFKRDMDAVCGCLGFTANHAEVAPHKALVKRQNEANAMYGDAVQAINSTDPDSAEREAAIEKESKPVLTLSGKLRQDAETLKRTTETDLSAWDAMADAYLEADEQVEDLELWGHKKAEKFLAAMDFVGKQVVKRKWITATNGLETLVQKLGPIHAEASVEQADRIDYEDNIGALEKRLKDLPPASPFVDELSDEEDACKQLHSDTSEAAKGGNFHTAAKKMKELEAALDAYEPKALKAGKEQKAEYDKSLAAVQERVKVVKAHADDKALEEESGKVFQILKEIAQQASTGHFAETTYRFEFLEDALVAFETALAKKLEIAAEFETALNALQTRTAPLSVMSNYEKLKDGYTKICDRLEKMKALGEEKKFAEGLKLAEPLNKAIDAFIAAFEKLDAAARGDLDTVVPKMRAQYDAIAKKLAPSTEVADLAKQVGSDVRWLETMVGDGMYSTASGSKGKIQKDLDKLEELNAFKLADEAIVERLGLLSMNAGRTEEKLKTLNDKAFELAAKMDELASKEDYKGALKLVAPTDKALDAYETELAKVEESDKVFAKECIGPLRARYDAIVGDIAPDTEVKNLAKEVEIGLKTIEATINGHRYSEARKEEPKVREDLDKLEDMNPYKLADEAIFQRMKAITWPSGDQDEKLKALSDKSGELGAQMDKLAEKGDYKGALKLAGPLSKVLDDYEAEFVKARNREAEAEERLRALQSEFDAESGNLADLQDVRDKAAEIEALLKDIDTAIKDGKYDLAREKEPLFAKLITQLVELNDPVRVKYMQDLQEFERKLEIPLDPPTKDLKDLHKYVLKGRKEMQAQAAKNDYQAASVSLSRLTGLLNDLAAKTFAHEDQLMKAYDDALEALQIRTAPLSVMSNYEKIRGDYDKICDRLEKIKALGDEGRYEEALKLVDPLNKAIDSFVAAFEKLDAAARGKLDTAVPKMRAQYDAIAKDLAGNKEVADLAKKVGGDVKWLETMLGDGMYSTALQSIDEIQEDLDKLQTMNDYMIEREELQPELDEFNDKSDYEELLKAENQKVWTLEDKMETAADKGDFAAAMKFAESLNKAIAEYLEAYKQTDADTEFLLKQALPNLKDNFDTAWDVPLPSKEMNDLADRIQDEIGDIEDRIAKQDYAAAQDNFNIASDLLDELMKLGKDPKRKKLLKDYEALADRVANAEVSDDPALKKDQKAIQSAYDEVKKLAGEGDYKNAGKQMDKVNKLMDAYAAKLEELETKDAA